MAEQSGPNLGVRGKPPKGITRQELEKIPQVILDELQRRVDEVTFAKEVFNKQWDGSSLNAAIKKYKGKIDPKRVKLIFNDPAKYVKQTGLGANPAILNQIDLASPAGFKKYVTKSLNDVKAAVSRLNKYLYPEGMTKKDILRSIHFAHGQGLASGGAHFGGSHMLDSGRKNVWENRWSGITKGKFDTKTKQFVVGDAYSAIGHPQFWDDAMTNYILGKDAPLLVELSDEAKQKIIHQGYDPDRIIIEQDNINLNRIDDDVAESIPFRHKGQPPKGEILTVDGKPPDPIQPTPQVTELGNRLGGIGTRLNVGGNLRRTDNLAQLGIAASQGDVVGTAISGTQLAAGEALQTRAVQAKLAKQVAKLAAQRGGKTALKLAPGVGLAISGAEAYGYAKQGSWDQAAVAALSGVVGELPGFGDAASAALDLWNTSQDISDLHKAAQQEAQLLKQGYNAEP